MIVDIPDDALTEVTNQTDKPNVVTDEQIMDIQAQLAATANDPNLTIGGIPAKESSSNLDLKKNSANVAVLPDGFYLYNQRLCFIFGGNKRAPSHDGWTFIWYTIYIVYDRTSWYSGFSEPLEVIPLNFGEVLETNPFLLSRLSELVDRSNTKTKELESCKAAIKSHAWCKEPAPAPVK